MPRRAPVRTACQQCRKSRVKCDGEPNCARCQNAGLKCIYDQRKAVSKESLRVEVKRLERLQCENDTLLEALSSDPGSFVTTLILQALKRGDSRESIARQVKKMNADEARSSARGSLSLENDVMDSEPTTSSSQYSIRHSTGSVMNDDNCSSISMCDTKDSTRPSPVELLEPLDPVAEALANGSGPLNPDVDPWTKSGWPKSHVRELVDFVLERDGMLFCLLRKDLFHQDFENGGTQYCSAALVNALLALATRIKQQDPGVNQPLHFSQQGLMGGSDGFFAEALTLLPKNGSRPNNLADIQALGILALYEASSDHEVGMQKLADEFATAMNDLCLREVSLQLKANSYESVRANTYCGSISLLRILRLSQASKHQNSNILQRPADYLGILQENNTIRQLVDDLDSHVQGISPNLQTRN
jgi:hypothetical protein